MNIDRSMIGLAGSSRQIQIEFATSTNPNLSRTSRIPGPLCVTCEERSSELSVIVKLRDEAKENILHLTKITAQLNRYVKQVFGSSSTRRILGSIIITCPLLQSERTCSLHNNVQYHLTTSCVTSGTYNISFRHNITRKPLAPSTSSSRKKEKVLWWKHDCVCYLQTLVRYVFCTSPVFMYRINVISDSEALYLLCIPCCDVM